MTLRKHLETGRLKLAGLPAADLEAEILLAHALESPRSFLYANPEIDLPKKRVVNYRDMVRRRARGEPIAYITGNREFWSLPLRITPDVLIPRHETELLVETTLHHLPGSGNCRLADLGTGSGAVALAIASERPGCEVHATDISNAAIALATDNAEKLGIFSVRFHTGSWCEPLDGTFDLMVSNPPYIAANDPHLSQGDCRFEPGSALSPGEDALSAFRVIAGQARQRLNSGGRLLFEHGTEQGPEVQQILSESGFSRVDTVRDLAGHERVTMGRL